MHWQNEVWARKPIAGFHPGIYRDLAMEKENKTDPFVHYLRAGSPTGKWKTAIISSTNREIVDTRKAKIGLHIHAYYAELLIDIASSLQSNNHKAGHIHYNAKIRRGDGLYKDLRRNWM